VSSVRFERTPPSASCWCLLPLGYEDVEPPPGADPGLLPYGGRVTSRVRRRSYRDWNRTSVLSGQSRGGIPNNPPGIECGRRDLNPHALRHRGLDPGRLPVSPPPLSAP
jgi:hypothetical protein